MAALLAALAMTAPAAARLNPANLAAGALLIGVALLGYAWAARQDGGAAFGTDDVRPWPVATILLPALGCLLLGAATRFPLVQALDAALAHQLQMAAAPRIAALLRALSEAGARDQIIRWAPLLAIGLIMLRRGRSVRFFLFSLVGSAGLELVMKALVLRARPGEGGAAAFESFPSGHALAAGIVAGALLAIGLPGCRHRWQRTALWTGAAAWALLMAAARVALARHYPLDVLGALLLAGAWVALGRALVLAWAPSRPEAVAAPVRPGRPLRLAARAAIAAAAVILLAGPWPVDRGGFRGQPYQQLTLRALAAGAGPAAAAAPLRAGYGSAEITPRPGEPLAGYGRRRGAGCRGAHDPQYARALALASGGEPVVLLTGDLLLVTDRLADAVAERVARTDGLARRQIYFAASHTHSGPGGYASDLLERFWLGGAVDGAFDRLAAAFAGAAHRALEQMAPAEWAYASGPLPEAIRNRVERRGPVDPALSVLSLRQPTLGQDLRLVVYGAHPTILPQSNTLASGDYPGFLTGSLERRRGVRALFCAGAVGSCSAAGLGGRRSFATAQAYGEALAVQVESLAARATYRRDAAIRALYCPVELGTPQVRVGPALRASPLLSGWLLGRRQGCVQGLAIGNLLLLGAPADINGELSLKVKEYAAARGYRPVVTSFAGRYVGYLVPERYYSAADDQEATLMSMYGPHNGEYFVSLLKAAVDRISAVGS
jgi:membrane-associated phospholipid phosphatase